MYYFVQCNQTKEPCVDDDLKEKDTQEAQWNELILNKELELEAAWKAVEDLKCEISIVQPQLEVCVCMCT